MSICWGALEFGQGDSYVKLVVENIVTDINIGYELANQTAYLDDMLRWSLDWLIKVSSNYIYV
jgi:endoglucanase